jgi:hypothetical protein
MGLSEALRDYLIADSGLQALIGSRLHPQILPQSPTLPAMTYQMISTTPHHTLQGVVALSRYRIQFDSWAPTLLAVEAVNDALRAALDGFSGGLGGSPPTLTVQGAFLVTERDWPYESEPELFRRSADYYVWVHQ